RDDMEITIPNSVIAASKIVNESGGPYEKERIRISIGIAYGSDIDVVREILLDIAKSNSYVQDEPEPRVRFREFGESELSFQLLCWIEEPVLRGRVTDQLNSEIYRTFNKKGIVIPFPQRTVHMHQVKDD
ncbi:MAG: mechanosensitive ion channel, partial [Candidatus Marinimicrobia bacterium]|nr:mechanosensitive ion channel [Candidatus Neomarinimicrobiota bacterium]